MNKRYAARGSARRTPSRTGFAHVCGLRRVFGDVQKVNCPAGAREAALGRAAAKNDQIAFAPAGAKLCEALKNAALSFFLTKRSRNFYQILQLFSALFSGIMNTGS